MSRKTKYYMHTINGKPAIFDGDQVCYGHQGMNIAKLPTSLKELRDEQAASIAWRRRQGFSDCVGSYGYLRLAEWEAVDA